jgi:DNA-binding HxlR family transcriptional regulator
LLQDAENAVIFGRHGDGWQIFRYTICTALAHRFPYAEEDRLSDRVDPGSYGQFCPIAMAAEVLCSRWTALVLREMLCGSTRFNDIRRGVPRMSPTLLSKRLKELEEAGVIAVRTSGQAGGAEYRLTEAGKDLRNVIMSLGFWGHRWIESAISLKNLDPSLLMWDMRRNLAPSSLPDRRCTINFLYPELGPGRKAWWLVIEDGQVDLCGFDPGHEVDLYVRSALRSMTAVWMGVSTLKAEIEAGNITLTGDKAIARSMHEWLGLSPFAKEKKSRAAVAAE